MYPIVYSLYWANIDQKLVEQQASVFEHLNIPLEQHCCDGEDHGDWMTRLLGRANDDEILIFCDIDAFPLSFDAYKRAVEAASKNHLFGLAQFSSHTPNSEIYAGPMFLALRKSFWIQLGSPNLRASSDHDAAEILTCICRERDKTVELVMPKCCIDVKWALGNQGTFGIGTFYGELEYFHLFESRVEKCISLFELVASDVKNDRPLSFSNYVSELQQSSLLYSIAIRLGVLLKRVFRKIWNTK